MAAAGDVAGRVVSTAIGVVALVVWVVTWPFALANEAAFRLYDPFRDER